jgi:hypothetical protein
LYVNNNDASLVRKAMFPKGSREDPRSVDISLVRKVEAPRGMEGSFRV